jgi:hypothetical protein
MEETIDQNDQIQLPPGWGPIVFLAAVILLSNAGLGLWVSSMVTTTPPRPATASSGPGPQAGAGGPGGGGPVVGGATGSQAGEQASTWQVDESEFTEELDETLMALARDNGMDPGTLPTAREIYGQMQRSNLLPRNQDLDLETVLSGHILELARQAQGAPGPQPKPADGQVPGAAPGAAPGAPPAGGPSGKAPPKGAPPKGAPEAPTP